MSWLLDQPYRLVLGLLSDGFGPLPPLSWVAVILGMGLLGLYAGGRGLAPDACCGEIPGAWEEVSAWGAVSVGVERGRAPRARRTPRH
jgi:hypothetical protein